eukprot:TRINITY_DN3866_c0_g1_i1.p1 TRINITY_DN3866_c0_g1~~TRINITY_DN3866_c0_g1_i1.p1  ORF type:complete len:335 (-),score=61.21 TRINITY_DN3866_c0_g1_i1:52-1056(-)
MFQLAEVQFDAHVTTKVGNAREIVASISLEGTSGIVTISGDGIIHEVVNGLLSRPDWKQASQIPIGAVPAGTGNALAVSMNARTPVDAAFAIVRGRVRALDVTSVVQSGQRYYSFLTVTWALVSDVDIESERLRFLGDLRLTLWAVWRLLFLRRYRGKLSFLPADATHANSSGCARNCRVCEDAAALVPIDAHEDQTSESSAVGPALRCVATAPTYSGGQDPAWKTIDDMFTLFCASNVAFQAADVQLTPAAHLSDGCIDLTFTRGLSRWQMIKLMLSIDRGHHVMYPGVETWKVRAYRLEIGPGGNLAVDGEVAPCESIASEIHCGLLRVFAA